MDDGAAGGAVACEELGDVGDDWCGVFDAVLAGDQARWVRNSYWFSGGDNRSHWLCEIDDEDAVADVEALFRIGRHIVY